MPSHETKSQTARVGPRKANHEHTQDGNLRPGSTQSGTCVTATAVKWLQGHPDAIDMPKSPWAVLSKIAWHYNDHDKGAWPSVPTLARGLHLSEATVYRALAWLEAEGWIERLHGIKPSTFYRLPRYTEPEAGRERLLQRDPSQSASDPSHNESGPSHHESDPSQPATQRTRTTRRTDERQVMPGGKITKLTHPEQPATADQLHYLEALHVMTSQYLMTIDERARNAVMTRAEAHEAIQAYTADVMREGPERLKARIPKPYLSRLAPEVRAYIERSDPRTQAA